jgi:hypothetical protein
MKKWKAAVLDLPIPLARVFLLGIVLVADEGQDNWISSQPISALFRAQRMIDH